MADTREYMRQRGTPRPAGESLEQIIAERAAMQARTMALGWRLRLVVIETIILSALILVVGLWLKQPPALVAKGALLIGGSCLFGGLALVALSAGLSRALTRPKRKRARP